MIENASVTDKLKNKYILLASGLVALVYIALAAKRHEDFYIYLLAAKDLFAWKDIYTLKYVDGYHYYYSVLFACLIYPLSYLPVYLANFIWLSLNFFFFTRIIKIIGSYFNLRALPAKQQWIFLGLCTVSCLKLVTENLDCQQITICILYLTLEGLERIWKGNKLTGALLIALAINFKLLPILLIPYLIYRREFLASFLIFLFYSILLEIPVVIIGAAQNNFLLSSWWNLVNPTNQKHILDTEEGGFNSITTWLATLLVYQEPASNEPHLRRNIANITFTQLEYAINITRLAFFTFSLYFLRTWPFVKKVGKMHRYWEVSYFLLITPLLFPHQQFYSFLLVAPALCYIYYHFLRNYASMSKLKYRLVISVMILSFLLCNSSFILGEFNAYYSYFKTLIYGILLIVPLLAISVPHYEKNGQINAVP